MALARHSFMDLIAGYIGEFNCRLVVLASSPPLGVFGDGVLLHLSERMAEFVHEQYS